MRAEWVRGITIGLWVLTGLSFLLHALFATNTGRDLLSPWLLALAVGWTAVQKPGAGGRPWASAPLVLLGAVAALGIAFTIISAGDRRSLLFVATTALVVLLLAFRR